MIALLLLVVLVVLLFTTPWRQLPRTGQTWALISCLNTLVCFSLPTTPATSPWRPVVSRALVLTVALSLALFIIGLGLSRRRVGGLRATGWLAPLIVSALPIATQLLLWLLWSRAGTR